jgi:flagellar biogenesis protein FliO
MTDMALQMAMALAFVVFLIFAASFLYRKKQKGSDFLSLVAYHSFGQKMGIAALRVGDEVLVLGVTPTDMKLLKKVAAGAAPPQEAAGIADKVKRLKRIKEEISR